MTREEATQHFIDLLKDEDAFTNRDKEAFDVAIKALSKEPCGDCISRETARRIIDSGRTKEQMLDMIANTPSVQFTVLDDIKAEGEKHE